MTARSLFLGLGGLIAGFIIGAFWLQTRVPMAKEASTTHPMNVSATDQELDRLRQENRDLKLELDRLKSSRPAERKKERKAEMLARLSAIIDSRKGFIGYGLPFLDYKGEIDELFAQCLDLTSVERRDLLDVINSARSSVADAERKQAKVVRTAAGAVEVTIDPFVEEGGKIYDQSMAKIAEILGPERNAAFLKLAGESFEHSFSNFGTRARVLTLSYDDKNLPGIYVVKEAWRLPDGNGTTNSQFRDEATLRKSLKHLGDLIPDFP